MDSVGISVLHPSSRKHILARFSVTTLASLDRLQTGRMPSKPLANDWYCRGKLRKTVFRCSMSLLLMYFVAFNLHQASFPPEAQLAGAGIGRKAPWVRTGSKVAVAASNVLLRPSSVTENSAKLFSDAQCRFFIRSNRSPPAPQG